MLEHLLMGVLLLLSPILSLLGLGMELLLLLLLSTLLHLCLLHPLCLHANVMCKLLKSLLQSSGIIVLLKRLC